MCVCVCVCVCVINKNHSHLPMGVMCLFCVCTCRPAQMPNAMWAHNQCVALHKLVNHGKQWTPKGHDQGPY